MEPVTGLLAAKTIQGVTNALVGGKETSIVKDKSSDPLVQKDQQVDIGEFSKILGKLLPVQQGGNINEEELYSGVIYERISALKGEEAANSYQQLLDTHKVRLMRPDGATSFEEAANSALKDMVASGAITETESGQISTEAFAAAQLDDNKSALYDGRGSANDPTMAVMAMEAALMQAKSVLNDIESGALDVSKLTASSAVSPQAVTPNGENMDGEGGFLYKPVSESDGNLVVLLPANFSSKVSSVVLVDSAGKELGSGRYSGLGNADSIGEREHYRFDKPGVEYSPDLSVEVRMQDGSVSTFKIPDPSKRYSTSK